MQPIDSASQQRLFHAIKKSSRFSEQLPMQCSDMDRLGWDSCDIIIVSGDAYIDHPSFGMAVIGRMLEACGYRVGIISQPDWKSADPFRALGRPNLFFGVTAGNMDSMVNHYTSERRIRSNDAYTPNGEAGKRPDRAVTVYAQRCREAFKGVPVVIGGIEASLRRIAHYDYWSDTVRRSVLPDSKADLLVYGNGERQIVEIAERLTAGETIGSLNNIRGTATMSNHLLPGFSELDLSDVDIPRSPVPNANPYADSCSDQRDSDASNAEQEKRPDDQAVVIRLPSYEAVKEDKLLYAHASKLMHLETNPGNARALVQQHGNRDVWINPPALPLTTAEIDAVFDLPYSRRPHDSYGAVHIPAWEMIKHSVNIMRGCFGGCSFCSITEHEGRIIQSRSEASIAREVEQIRDKTPGFKGTISDLGGPTANMYRLSCRSSTIEAACRKPSCVYPSICKNLITDHTPLIRLYRKVRQIRGIKRVFIASGVRYDLAVESPEYIEELVTHHVGGYLKIAPEHTEDKVLSMMLKPGIESFERFRKLFEHYSKKAGKQQYLIPYFIAAHPGAGDEEMLNLALWLKANRFKPDQVQAFLPSPMATASAMYHSELNPLGKISRRASSRARPVFTVKRKKQRDLHKAFLRYHDPENWPLLREALIRMGRSDLIGTGQEHLVPPASGSENRPRRNREGSGRPHRKAHRIAKRSTSKQRRR